MTSGSSKTELVIYVAIMGNLVIASMKFLAAAHTGSSAMLSEGIHSTADTEEVLLNIEAQFVLTLSANELAKVVSQLRRYHPNIKRIFMEVAPMKG
ncbi:hypothetical protein SAMN05216315_13019 [Nitrosospira sp. Nsp18]|uniref:cation transporter n=1 Tax=Nitrosospira sp. Nsp18 TaxID=1855334 RepID=UPI000890E9C2|nr:cation transporter [Nitrosospira sp. Nsp18]SDA26460.1 hypothetical protein SAMN05216315_13019 [Nitrosospira sp. Nsp18]